MDRTRQTARMPSNNLTLVPIWIDSSKNLLQSNSWDHRSILERLIHRFKNTPIGPEGRIMRSRVSIKTLLWKYRMFKGILSMRTPPVHSIQTDSDASYDHDVMSPSGVISSKLWNPFHSVTSSIIHISGHHSVRSLFTSWKINHLNEEQETLTTRHRFRTTHNQRLKKRWCLGEEVEHTLRPWFWILF